MTKSFYFIATAYWFLPNPLPTPQHKKGYALAGGLAEGRTVALARLGHCPYQASADCLLVLPPGKNPTPCQPPSIKRATPWQGGWLGVGLLHLPAASIKRGQCSNLASADCQKAQLIIKNWT